MWRKDCFAWEYKGKHANLDAAYAQVQRYAPALRNPPLLIVSDMDRIVIRTSWTGAVQEMHEIGLTDLRDSKARDLLRDCFENPARLKPRKTRADLTEEAAAKFAALAMKLRQRGHDPQTVSHFVNRLVFCLFAEDVHLLPNRMFERMVQHCLHAPEDFEPHSRTLFAAMAKGGMVGFERVEWFNGGLFDDEMTLALTKEEVRDLHAAAKLNWSEIDASLLGTLFERGLDPDKRSQLGAHYTDAAKIMQIVEPVVLRPLRTEWEGIRPRIEAALTREREAMEERARTPAAAKAGALTRRANEAHAEAERLHLGFLERLRNFRVLDPACGSGNFLNLALTGLKDLEHAANLDAEALGLLRPAPQVGPEAVLGIELNPYAAELARVSTWIAEIQWMRRNGFEAGRNPILRELSTIRTGDAVLAEDGTRADWPKADAIVGNPPFLGNKKMIAELGEDYATRLRRAWPDVPGGVDLVAYWVAGAWRAMEAGGAERAGLVTTNSIRGGANREVLKPVVEGGRIFEAWSDEPWTVEGAAVRVSMVMFDRETGPGRLDGKAAERIHSNLTGEAVDITGAAKLAENDNRSFVGIQKTGPFNVPGELARKVLTASGNPNGKPNSDVIAPYWNGMDLTRRWRDIWLIDFTEHPEQEDASLYEAPFEYLVEHAKPMRAPNKIEWLRDNWWLLWRSRPEMREANAPLQRYIVTPEVSKHRVFAWKERPTLPDKNLMVIARDDDTTFGILHSRFHEVWSLRMGTFLGKGNDPRYTPSTTFETFPFPEGLTPDLPASAYAADPHAAAIAAAARDLDEKRDAWLNPPDLVDRVPEVVPGYPDRLIPKDAAAEKVLKKRTLTNLYNARPAWLAGLHDRLDAAVAAAYGWEAEWKAGMGDEAILAALFALNQQRAKAQEG